MINQYVPIILFDLLHLCEKLIWCAIKITLGRFGTTFDNTEENRYKPHYESGEMTPSPESIVGWLLENQDTIVELKPLMAGKQISK